MTTTGTATWRTHALAAHLFDDELGAAPVPLAMAASAEPRACRSKSPKGHPCSRPRGHKSSRHRNAGAEREWRDGVRVPASWIVLDDGRMTEGDHQSWGRWSR